MPKEFFQVRGKSTMRFDQLSEMISDRRLCF